MSWLTPLERALLQRGGSRVELLLLRLAMHVLGQGPGLLKIRACADELGADRKTIRRARGRLLAQGFLELHHADRSRPLFRLPATPPSPLTRTSDAPPRPEPH